MVVSKCLKHQISQDLRLNDVWHAVDQLSLYAEYSVHPGFNFHALVRH